MAGSILTGFFLGRSVLEAAARGFAGTGAAGVRGGRDRPAEWASPARPEAGSAAMAAAARAARREHGPRPGDRRRSERSAARRPSGAAAGIPADRPAAGLPRPSPAPRRICRPARSPGGAPGWRWPRACRGSPVFMPWAIWSSGTTSIPIPAGRRTPRRISADALLPALATGPNRAKGGGCSPTSPGSGRPDCSSRGRSAASCRPSRGAAACSKATRSWPGSPDRSAATSRPGYNRRALRVRCFGLTAVTSWNGPS